MTFQGQSAQKKGFRLTRAFLVLKERVSLHAISNQCLFKHFLLQDLKKDLHASSV